MKQTNHECIFAKVLTQSVCFSAGGADEQHRASAELQATDQQHHQPVQPAAFLEHVQQVKTETSPTQTHMNTHK